MYVLRTLLNVSSFKIKDTNTHLENPYELYIDGILDLF